tara:strand:- start:376 stop:1272 length:897 start_codon:yes stop_codon:yes gene_type:complete
MTSLPVFLFHYGPFEPLWEQDGLIQCGPMMLNEPRGIGLKKINIFELKNSLERKGIPSKGVLVHYTDPFIIRANVLDGLKYWNGPKLLVCGDLHHGESPIKTLFDYQSREFHDSVLLAFNPILCEEVRRALSVPVHCFPPGFFRYPIRHSHPNRKKCLLHIGNVGPYHVRRRSIIDSLSIRNRIPFYHTTTQSSQEAADLYNQYSLVLNIPLNNDLNHRFFEIISAGTSQVVFGEKSLLGNLEDFSKLPNLYWANSIDELENLVINLFKSNINLTTNSECISYLPIKDLLLRSFSHIN